MLSYIKKEINRLLNWRILLSIGTGCLCVAASLRVYSAEAAMSFYAILVYLCYLFMIGICIGLATDDFESGAFIQVFTGKLSAPRVIAAKIIAAGIYAVLLSVLIYAISLIAVCGHTVTPPAEVPISAFGMAVISYSAGALLAASFAILMGSWLKNQGICLILMYVLFFWEFSHIVELAQSHLRLGAFISFLLTPFTLVPELMLNGATHWTRIGLCVVFSMINYGIVCLTRKWWIG